MHVRLNGRLKALTCALVALGTAASSAGGAAAGDFALTFRPGQVGHETAGAAGDANAETISNLLTALSLRTAGAAFELILTGPRPTSCRDDTACSQLLFGRVRHLNAALQQRDAGAAGRGLVENLNRYAEDMREAPVLPAASGTGETLFVRTLPSKPYVADEKCPFVARIGDPALPPGLDGRPLDVQVVSPRTIAVTPNSTIRVTPSNHEGRRVAIVWDGGDNLVRGAVGATVAVRDLLGGHPERVHVIAADKADNPTLRAAEALPTVPGPDRTRFLAQVVTVSSRGFGPDAQAPAPRAGELPRLELVSCSVPLVMLSVPLR